MASHHVRLPVSTRHAFALAFDLAVRRDAWHSLVVPLLLRAPWIVALALLPRPDATDRPVQVVLLAAFAAIGEFAVFLVTTAMLRFRAESVFNTSSDVRPAAAVDCYARGLTRVPWLFLTETARSLILLLLGLLVLPAIFLLYRLSFATEAVVLREPHLSAAFRRSYHMTAGRFERWFELTVISVLLGLAVMFVLAMFFVAFPSWPMNNWFAAFRVLMIPVTTVIQYAWTFFFLRLVEIEFQGVEVGPAYAAAPAGWAASGQPPRLTLVKPASSEASEPLGRRAPESSSPDHA